MKTKGFTILEGVIASVILIIIIAAALATYHSTQKSGELGREEAQMQSWAKTAMMTITRELRQASSIWITQIPASSSSGCQEASNTSSLYSKDIRFTVPVIDSNSNLYGYKIIRYWYVRNPETCIWSLRRFVWDKASNSWVRDVDPLNRNLNPNICGNAKDISLAGSIVTPVNEEAQPTTMSQYNSIISRSTALLQEAAVVDPGIQSYFELDPNDSSKSTILVRLVTAVYKVKTGGTNWRQRELKRTFVLTSEVKLRNK